MRKMLKSNREKPVQKYRYVVSAILTIILFSSCQSMYYKAAEKVGYHKRDILVSRVEKARDSQQEAKEQFSSALDRFSEVLKFSGGDLEDKYKTLQKEYDRSASRAGEVHDRISAVEDVGEALFDEWKKELGQYSNSGMRKSSESKLRKTRAHYEKMIGAMKKAESRIEPVLKTFYDQVLYLKHNLNAQAIASLQAELGKIESDVGRLIREMEASISEANAFMGTLSAE